MKPNIQAEGAGQSSWPQPLCIDHSHARWSCSTYAVLRGQVAAPFCLGWAVAKTPSHLHAHFSCRRFWLKAVAQHFSWTIYSVKRKKKKKSRKRSAYWFSHDPNHLVEGMVGLFLSLPFKVQSLNYRSSEFVLVCSSRWDTTVNFHFKRLIVHEVQ